MRKRIVLTALVLAVTPLAAPGRAQTDTVEAAPRSTLLGIAMPYAPSRVTGGYGYTAEAAQMGKGARSWNLGKCTSYELLYWPTGLKVKPAVAYAAFRATVKTAGWSAKDVFNFDPLDAFVLSKGARRVLASVVMDRGPTLSLCELAK